MSFATNALTSFPASSREVYCAPALIGKKLRQPTFRGKQYFELDVDIGSSAVANRVVGLVSGYTKKLVIDTGFVLEGQSPDELPKRLFGSVRLVHLDLGVAKKLS